MMPGILPGIEPLAMAYVLMWFSNGKSVASAEKTL
jgi:hypothetical protein